MKKTYIFVLCVSLILFSFITSDYKKYTAKEFSINYPSDWALNDGGDRGTRLYFSQALTSKKDKFQENGNVLIETLSEEISLEDYVAASLVELRSIFPDYKVVSKTKVKINDENAMTLTYTTKVGKLKLQLLQCFIVKDKKIHIISCGAETKTFESNLPTFLAIVGSYKIL